VNLMGNAVAGATEVDPVPGTGGLQIDMIVGILIVSLK